jgi:hypothetical protein
MHTRKFLFYIKKRIFRTEIDQALHLQFFFSQCFCLEKGPLRYIISAMVNLKPAHYLIIIFLILSPLEIKIEIAKHPLECLIDKLQVYILALKLRYSPCN